MEEIIESKKFCQHCKKNGIERLASRPRGLCRPCYENKEIRVLYSFKEKHLPGLNDPNLPLLPKLGEYPDPRKRDICIHGQWDGECPICERAQRKDKVYDEFWHVRNREEEIYISQVERRMLFHKDKDRQSGVKDVS